MPYVSSWKFFGIYFTDVPFGFWIYYTKKYKSVLAKNYGAYCDIFLNEKIEISNYPCPDESGTKFN